eukprot:COSAG02_NODE_82_length_39723_cov_247.146650_4_plen_159_part_00
MQAPDEAVSDSDGETQILGSIIGGYLVCMLCCTSCCVVGAGSLLWSGIQCLSQPADDGEACSRAGAYAMIFFGSFPLVFAVAAQVYLQADARGWFRPNTVLPGTLPPQYCDDTGSPIHSAPMRYVCAAVADMRLCTLYRRSRDSQACEAGRWIRGGTR